MDAATPLRRWLLAASLLPTPLAGCSSTTTSAAGGPGHDPRAAAAARDAEVAGVDPYRGRIDSEPRDLRELREYDHDRSKPTTARPQAPQEVPAGPLPPVVPEVGPGQPTGQTIPAGYTPGGAGLLRGLADAAPRVKVVAVIGAGNVITDQEVLESVRQRMGEYVQLTGHEREAKERALYVEELRKVIERELILDEMFQRLKKAKPGVIDELKDFAAKAADRQLREFKKFYRVRTDDEFRDLLASQGLTLPVIRRQLERQMMADEYVRSMLKEKGRAVGLGEIHDYYLKNPGEFATDDRVKWLDVFVSFNRFATAREAFDHAEAIRRQAAAGADFVALSRQHDHGLAGQQNGEGVGQKRGEIRPADVEPAVWALRPGEVSGLIETPAGYHVVKVVEREHAGTRPFDPKVQAEIREKLTKRLREQEYRRLVEELWRKAAIRVLDEG
jgi:peptidyl-prolyl cis-trans isomerase SurA